MVLDVVSELWGVASVQPSNSCSNIYLSMFSLHSIVVGALAVGLK